LSFAMPSTPHPDASVVDSTYSWVRLAISLLITAIGGIGLWSYVVVLPAIETEFSVPRADASLPYTVLMIGFAVGGIVMGRALDRFGITVPLSFGAAMLALGYILAGQSQSLWQFALAHGLLIGMLGSSATFGPVIADISRWFLRRRGIAIAIVACGNYLGGAVWPPIVQYFVETAGWRDTHTGIGLFCLATILPLSWLLRRRPPLEMPAPAVTQPSIQSGEDRSAVIALTPESRRFLQGLLIVAGLACCIAMAMPQVHIVALCVDLGYGSARGAQMLSVMLLTGIISRLAFGMLADRLGALPTLLTSSTLQALSLLMFLPFDGLVPLFMVSALFGLAQGGIVPTYAVVVREYFPSSEAGSRIGLVLSATLLGMAIGGWMSGAIHDYTLSYELAFVNGFLWNLLNLAIVVSLLFWLPRRAFRQTSPA
jgi:MFS family permease